ncbi:hypothetical protein L596_008156 [Steinernema carpocapsae]|uniref:non-specific serine/threonine protein kinase n=1 Tax=Steinernema carpocapsae TaxID=34508 RepID=A0A4V6A682_STECR|nr:hypothetical protein L596_008156 [Steinernema carpocapsae]
MDAKISELLTCVRIVKEAAKGLAEAGNRSTRAPATPKTPGSKAVRKPSAAAIKSQTLDALAKAARILEPCYLHLRIVEDPSWVELFADLVSIADSEFSTNKKKSFTKLNENAFLGHCLLQKAFRIFIKYRLTIGPSERSALADCGTYFSNLFIDSEAWRETHVDLFNDAADNLRDLFLKFSVTEIGMENRMFIEIWNSAVEFYTAAKGRCSSHLVELIAVLAKNARWTLSKGELQKVFQDINKICTGERFKRDVEGNKATILDLVAELFIEHSLEHRETLLNHFSSFLNVISETVSLNRLNEKNLDEKNYQWSLFRLIEVYLAVCVPDGHFELVSEKMDGRETVENCMERLANDVKSKRNSSFQKDRKTGSTVLEDDRLPLLSRILFLDHQAKQQENILRNAHHSGKPKKRTYVEESRLLEYVKQLDGIRLQLLASVLSRWKQCLQPEFIEEAVENLFRFKDLQEYNVIQSYMQCFVEVLADGAYALTQARVGELWKTGLAYLTIPHLCATASHLLRCVYPKVVQMWPNNREHIFRTLTSNVARLSAFPEETIHLLGSIFRSEEFDENATFRYDFLVGGDCSSGSNAWPFRRQVVAALLDDYSKKVNFGELLLTLTMLHPEYEIEERSSREPFEAQLSEFYSPEIPEDRRQDRQRAFVVIPEVVEVIRATLLKNAANETEFSGKSYWWKVYLRFYSGLKRSHVDFTFMDTMSNVLEEIEQKMVTIPNKETNPFRRPSTEEVTDGKIRCLLEASRDLIHAGSTVMNWLSEETRTNRKLDVYRVIFYFGEPISADMGSGFFKPWIFQANVSAEIVDFHYKSCTISCDLLLEIAQRRPGMNMAKLLGADFTKNLTTNLEQRNLHMTENMALFLLQNAKFTEVTPELVKSIAASAPPRTLALNLNFKNSSFPNFVLLISLILDDFQSNQDHVGAAYLIKRIFGTPKAYSLFQIVVPFMFDGPNKALFVTCEKVVPTFWEFLRFCGLQCATYVQRFDDTHLDLVFDCIDRPDFETLISEILETSGIRGVNEANFLATERTTLSIFGAAFPLAALERDIGEEVIQKSLSAVRTQPHLQFCAEIYATLYANAREGRVLAGHSAFTWLPSAIQLLKVVMNQKTNKELSELGLSQILVMVKRSVRDSLKNGFDDDSMLEGILKVLLTIPGMSVPSEVILYRLWSIYDMVFENKTRFPSSWAFLQSFDFSYAGFLEDSSTGCKSIEDSYEQIAKQLEEAMTEFPAFWPVYLLKGFWIYFCERASREWVSDRRRLGWIQLIWFTFPEVRSNMIPVLKIVDVGALNMNPVWSQNVGLSFYRSFVEAVVFDSEKLYSPTFHFGALQQHLFLNNDPLRLIPPDFLEQNSIALMKRVCGMGKSATQATFALFSLAKECESEAIVFLPLVVRSVLADRGEMEGARWSFFTAEIGTYCAALSEEEEYSELQKAHLVAFAQSFEVLNENCPDLVFEERSNWILFVKCLIRANLYEYASFFLHVYMDTGLCQGAEESRIMFHLEAPEHDVFLGLLEQPDLTELFAKIFIGLKDLDAVLHLLPEVKLEEAKIFSYRQLCQWTKVVDNDERFTADSNYAMGKRVDTPLFSRGLVFENALRLADWDNVVTRASFPKKTFSHQETLFATLFNLKSEWSNGKNSEVVAREIIDGNLEVLGEKLSNDAFLNSENVKRFIDFQVLQQLSEDEAGGAEGHFDLVLSWNLAKLSQSSKATRKLKTNLGSALLSRCKDLCRIKAFAPAVSLLEVFHEEFEVSRRVEYIVELAKANLGIGNAVRARRLLTDTAESVRDRGSADMFLECKMLLSETDTSVEKKFHHEEMQDVLVKSATKMELSNDVALRALLMCARFAERDYQEMDDFIKSDAFKVKEEAVSVLNRMTEAPMAADTAEQRNLNRRTNRELAVELQQIKNVGSVLVKRRNVALQFYLDMLRRGDRDPLTIYRVASLLMRNANEEDVIKTLKRFVTHIPAHVWLPVVNHLSSHMFSEGPISAVMKGIIKRVLVKYPYHTLHFIFFYTAKSSEQTIESRRRWKIATQFLKECAEVSKEIREIITKLQTIHGIYNQFADADPDDPRFFRRERDQEGSKYYLLDSLDIWSKRQQLTAAPIPIITQKVVPDSECSTADLIFFSKVGHFCQKAGGLTTPKYIKIRGSDGVIYQLIAKKEDLRQDSLVQQLFEITNTIVATDDPLSIRTYHVLPLNADHGFIEWCKGTQSLCSVLIGSDRKSGLHKEINPNDPTAADLAPELDKLNSVPDDTKAGSDFKKLCRQINPVFRYHFYGCFKTARAWREAIRRYTTSLARWSVVCFIVGLGDRHLNNILIDSETGQLVHIDLGMIFEYSSRVLPIPERVPFRLTRDLVDPLMVDGVHGSFKRIACDTLKKIREESSVLYGIGHLLLTDPVSSFRIISKIKDEVKDAEKTFSKTALSRFKLKLQGIDLLELTYRTPEDQTSSLIDDARHPENLARMFKGWMALI